MMHYSCDLCGKDLRPEDEPRYIIKIEAYAAHDPAKLTDADLVEDHLQAVSEILQDMEITGEEAVDKANKNFRFDLCPECHKRFVRDPLGKEQGQKLFFSKN